MKIIKTYENYNLEDLDLGRFAPLIKRENLHLNSDGTYNYDADLNFSSLNLKSLLEIPIRFRKIFGSFDCSFNNLVSLEGAPLEVGSSFACYDNNLISLQYAPKEIGEYFWCEENNLLSKAHSSEIGSSFIYQESNPFGITDGAIKTVKKMTHVQQMKELDFFKQNDLKAFEMMKEILDGLGIGYGEETRSMVGVMNKDFTNAKEMF